MEAPSESSNKRQIVISEDLGDDVDDDNDDDGNWEED